MVDVVASFGYTGQELNFIDQERFAHSTGKGIYIYDTVKGPREIVWRNEKDLKYFSSNAEASLLVLSFTSHEHKLEIVRLNELTNPIPFENPYKCAITNFDISRTCDKIFGLSDVIDHRLTVWTIDGDAIANGKNVAPRMVANKKLDFVCRKVVINPCDASHAVLYGNDGIYYASLHELFETYTLKIEKIFPVQPKSTGSSEIISFCIWLPFNRILAGLDNGTVYEINCETKAEKYLGKFMDPLIKSHSNPGIIYPSVVTITSQYAILGTHDGGVYWYPINSLLTETPSVSEDDDEHYFQQPVRVLKLNQAVSTFAIDPTFSVLMIGTHCGSIVKAAVESEVNGDVDLKNDHDEDNDHSKKVKCELVEPQFLGNDGIGGVVVSSRFLSLGVRKISSRAKANLSMLMLGTHDGCLSIWRHATPGPENIPSTQGIRRSSPRTMKELIRIPMHSRNSAIVSMEWIFFGPNTAILCAGLDSGMLEFWCLNCTEQEEDDTKENSSNIPTVFTKMTEDDEGSIIVKFELSFLLKTKVYNGAFSSLTAVVESSSEVKLAVCSAFDPMVYVFSILKNANLDLGRIVASWEVPVADNSAVVSTLYHDDYLFAVTDNNLVMRYMIPNSLREPGEPEQLKAVQFSGVAVIHPSPNQYAGLAINQQGIAFYYTHSDDANYRVVWDKMKTRKLIEHKDLVSSAAFSPNGNLLGIGSIDGTLNLWKIEGETCNDILLINTLELHSAAIISIVFSADSSTIFTTAVDGTCNMLFVGGKSAAKTRQITSIQKPTSSILSVDEDFSVSDLHYENNEVVLKDKLASEAEKELRASYKFKCMGVSAAIKEIIQRLNVLVQQNNERTPLEQLNCDEFVIDVVKKKELEAKNEMEAVNLREQYHKRQKWLELLAARLRHASWDNCTDVATRLRPFVNPPEFDSSNPEGISSFSVPKFTSKESMYLEKAKRLRRLEIRSMKQSENLSSIRRIRGTNYYRCSWAVNVQGCPPDASYIVNDGLLWPLNKPQDADNVNAGSTSEKDSKAVAPPVVNKDTSNANNNEDDLSTYSNDEDIDVDENEFLNLVYAPQITRTVIQKKNQLLFLKEIARRIKQRFNKVFISLRQEKDDIIQFVNARSDRIAEIFGELKSAEERIWRPKLQNDEIVGSHIVVSPEEMSCQPYESEAVKLQKQKEAEERAAKALGDENELTKLRALDDMMHGTLEVKRDVLAEALSTHKPAWMDELAPSEMTEFQLKEYETFQEKLRIFQEEQAHYRKTLEQEMKKLKQEIVETCKVFNEKLDVLGKDKILVQKEILSQEMYMTSIANSIVKAEALRNSIKKHEESLVQYRKDRTELKNKIERFTKRYDEMKNKLLAIQEEEKNMEKTFKRDLQNLCNNTFDQDSLKVFTQLYRHRIYPRNHLLGPSAVHGEGGDHDSSEIDQSASASNRMKRSKDISGRAGATNNKHNRSQSKNPGGVGGGGGGKGGKNAGTTKMKQSRNVSAGGGASNAGGGGVGMGPLQQAAQALRSLEAENGPSYKEKDPFYGPSLLVMKQKKQHEVPLPLLNMLSMELDCPEGFVVDQFSWSKLQELRTGRIEKEIEEKSLTNELYETKTKLQVLDDEEVKFSQQVNESRGQRDQSQDKLKNVETNLDIIVYLFQGQDEVDSDSVVTDYSSGILIPVDVINKFNSRIKELGGDKIGVLSKIKLFRRKINLIAWEAMHQGLVAKHFENYYTDLQLFRVTRDLQKVILEGENAFNQKERCDKINTRKDYLTKEYQARNQQIIEKLQLFKKQLRERENESEALREKIDQLDGQVNMSQGIKRSKEAAMGPGNTMENVYLEKMKKVVNRRKLVDLARAQAEEIDFLRQELDRMRQRTFPSFVK
jgi:WD40 repeat protein